MTIRQKIFLLAGILLALFGVVVGVLGIIQKLDSDQIGNIVGYELPLSRLVAEFDVNTDRYELNVLRVLLLDPASPEQLQAVASAKQALADELRSDVATSGTLLQKAIKDPHYDPADRVDLARIEGSFKYLSRSLEEFLAVGDLTMAAIADGRREDARTASLGFAKFAQAFGPDLSEIRRAIAELTDRSTRTVLARQRLNTYLSFALFLAACGIGLGISAVGSTRVIDGLRRLVASTRAIESGADWVPVVIRSRDEVGELAFSFNRMVEELRTRERIKETFGKFVDPRIVTRLIGNGAEQAERRNLTVFFSDIKAFSGISEQLTASAIVNLLNSYFGASRLESINKLYGTSIILSEETFRLAQQVVEARELDLITVGGTTEPVRIYEAMGRAGELRPEQSELRDQFGRGLAAYRRQDWDEAQTHFESCLRTIVEDGPTHLFLERIALLRTTPPPADWSGIWQVSEK
jgi:adenylate cyclase